MARAKALVAQRPRHVVLVDATCRLQCMHGHVALQCPRKNKFACNCHCHHEAHASAHLCVCVWEGGEVELYVWVGAHRALEHAALAFNLDDTNIIEYAE